MRRVPGGRGTIAIALAVVITACRYQPLSVPLQASPADISALAGKWAGEYIGRESGRSGTIAFTIQAGRDTAYGDVIMEPSREPYGQPVRAADVETGEHLRHSQAPELLRVTLVRISGGLVEGVLEPYIAPDCHCTVTTTFRGALAGASIKGDFLTTGPYGLRQTGTWNVMRQSTPATIAK